MKFISGAAVLFGLLEVGHGAILDFNTIKEQLPIFGSNSGAGTGRAAKRKNVVFILTDDQDLHMNSLDYMPHVQKHLVDQGTLYKRHFTTTAVCCPARVSILTGKAPHNTNVTDLTPPYGGFPKFVREGHNENYLPVWVQAEGYNTYYTGKLFNSHTVENYNDPHVKGWTESDFLLDPYTYMYYNSTFQRNHDAPVSHEGEYTTDVLAQKTQGFLDSALAKEDPFFLVVAPNAPHSNVDADLAKVNFTDIPRNWTLRMTSPIPAERHAHLFKDVVVPRTENFNPDSQIVPSWFRDQPKLTQENIDYNDEFYRNRLRALQAVDELVDGVFKKLEDAGVLDDTYVVYTTDNGFHISQHRLQPGKECGFEEDINIPLIIRGPNVVKGAVSNAVTTHADLAPTFLSLIGAPQRADFDGVVIPLTIKEQEKAKTDRHEHVTVEYWGFVASEGKFPYHDKNGETFFLGNNTYKSIRIVGQEYDLYYSVWCHGEHELYDLQTDPGQLRNLLDEKVKPKTLIGYSLESVVARLDSLLLVGKTCKGIVCSQPWKALHPQGDVKTLGDALREEFDEFYEQRQPRISFGWCVGGHVLEAEGAQFERDGLAYWRPDWSVWV